MSAIDAAEIARQGERLERVRRELSRRGVAAYCLPRADEYLGEYIPAHNERLHWLTAFSGSAGMAVITAESAAIFIDGRYTVQVRQQVSAEHYAYRHLIDSPPLQWLKEQLPAGSAVLVDPRMCTLRWYRRAQAELEEAGLELRASTDNPVDACWDDRPEPRVAPALLLEERFSGECSLDKRRRLGEAVRAARADAALVFAPESLSWMLNVRGRDIPRQPIMLGFALLESNGELHVAVDPRRIPPGFVEHVGEGVHLVDERDAERLLRRFSGRTVLSDPDDANAWTQLTLAAAGATLREGQDPVLMPKACKNPVEQDGARAAHRRDGAAVTRFLAWLDREVAAGRLHDEAALAEQLGTFRAGGEHYHEPSFDTISAAVGNAAMCHYNFRNGQPARLAPGSLYLVDSGGQYSDGTTDITRTVAIGEPSAEMRELFTRVLKGHIALSMARFPRGTTGTHLDALARQFLWQRGCDYDHGTGHGVGAFLSVHEGPQRISRAWNATALAPGMIVSNEPGYYRDNAFGIRCENLCLVVEVNEPEMERPMLGFETLTLAPFDRRLVDLSLLEAREIHWLDAYHGRVAEELAGQLAGEDLAWLESATAPLASPVQRPTAAEERRDASNA